MKRKPNSTAAPTARQPARGGGWRSELETILDEHNNDWVGSTKHVLHSTRKQRRKVLLQLFGTLRGIGVPVHPANLGGRHVADLVQYWLADPRIVPTLKTRGATLAPRETPVAPSTLAHYLSVLRVFSCWIRKRGLVPSVEQCLQAQAEMKMSQTFDTSPAPVAEFAGVDALLARVAEHDPLVAVQFEVLLAFGLQREDAVVFNPLLAEVPVHARPSSERDARYISILRINRGKPSARLLYMAVITDDQRRALARARTCAVGRGHIGRPGLTVTQSVHHFSYVLKAAGLTTKLLGTTASRLRQRADIAMKFRVPRLVPPSRGNLPANDPKTMEAAYLEIARQLERRPPRFMRCTAPIALPTQLSLFGDDVE